MSCVSSKHLTKQLNEERTIIINNGGAQHVVSLTSSTLGALKLDNVEKPVQGFVSDLRVWDLKVWDLKMSPNREEPEVINTWELIKDLEEAIPVIANRKSPKSGLFLCGFADVDTRSPLKFLNQIGSPRKVKKSGGKENNKISLKPKDGNFTQTTPCNSAKPRQQ